MSKEIYIVNCYTCQHNGQETCKGCNTLLNGDVEPYENWELREDLSQKDQRIAELEKDLEFTTKTANELIEIKHKLEQELAEKQNTINEINKEFVQAVHDWKTLCAEKDKEIAHLKEMDNYHLLYELAGADETIANLKKQLEEKDKDKTRLAIQELEKVKDTLKHFCEIHSDEFYGVKSQVKGIEQNVCESIDYQIKEFKGE